MRIYTCGETGLFALSTESTTYAMEVSDAGYLLHLYWGARLDRTEDLPRGEQLQFYPFEEPDKKPKTNQEYAGWGGYFFDEPCLKVLFSDGCRDLDLVYDSYEILRDDREETLKITLKEKVYPVKVHLYYRIYMGLEVIDRFAVVENAGESSVIIENMQSAALYVPRGKGYRLTHMSGKWAGEYMLEQVKLTQSKVVVESRRGVSGPDSCPWFALDLNGEATEDTGKVWAGSIHWNGNWKIVAEVNRVEQTRVTGGINDFDFSWKLKPGESFSAPVFSLVYTDKGFGEASRHFHDYQKDYLVPRTKANELRPLIFNSWEVFEFDINAEQQIKLAEKAAELGVELFVVDDGWFGGRDNDKTGLGDWYPSKSKFPNGLKPLIDKVNGFGMDFGIWVEPEMVNCDSDLYRAHPDWVLRFPGKELSTWRNQFVLNFARDDVREFAYDFLYKLLSENNIAYLKWDMNRYLSEAGWPEAPVDEQRSVWVKYARNVLDVYGRIQKNFPHVIVENCASGGARIDLAMAGVSDMVNTSDNADPLDNLKIIEGYTQVFLPKTSGRGISVSPNFINMRTTPMRYRAHVGMMGTFIIGIDLFKCSDEEICELKGYAALYKDIRETVQNGRLYRLASAYKHPYAVFQFVNESKSESVLFVFGQSIQFRRPIPRIRLGGLDPQALYEVEGSKHMSGKGLMEIGIETVLLSDFDSKIIRIKKI